MKIWLFKILHKFLSRFFLSGCSDYNSLQVRSACRSKTQARLAFEKNNLPYAQGINFINPMDAFKFSDKHGFPLVVKPNVGGFSRGAYFPIENKTQLLRAVIGVKKWWPVSIIESYLWGSNYRVVVTKQGVMSVLRRYPPFVIGDGVQTIESLIDAENITRIEMELDPITKKIPKNLAIKNHLKKQNLNLKTVLEKQQLVYLHHKIALKLGSSVEVIEKTKLPKENIDDLLKILHFFDANILGIDVICEKGIEVEFNQQKCIFLELNSRPFLAMHDKPRYGTREDLTYYYKKLNQLNITDNEIY
jgi:D-alanine-D-alanine ligase-like ATP-grasp enzyme